MNIKKLKDTFDDNFELNLELKQNKRLANLLLDDYAGRDSFLTLQLAYQYQCSILGRSEEELADFMNMLSKSYFRNCARISIMIEKLGGDPMIMNSNGKYFTSNYINYSGSFMQVINRNIAMEEALRRSLTIKLKMTNCENTKTILEKFLEINAYHLEILKEIKGWIQDRRLTDYF